MRLDNLNEAINHLEDLESDLELGTEVPLPKGFKGIISCDERTILDKSESLIKDYFNEDVHINSIFSSDNKLMVPYVISEQFDNIIKIINDYVYQNEKFSKYYPPITYREEVPYLPKGGLHLNKKYKDAIPHKARNLAIEEMNITEDQSSSISTLPFQKPELSELWSDRNFKVIQEGFELGNILLNYFPYSIDFSGEHISIKNLYTGKKTSGKKFLPEMNGFNLYVQARTYMNCLKDS